MVRFAALLLVLAPTVAWAAPDLSVLTDIRPVLAWIFAAIGAYQLVLWRRLRQFPDVGWFGLLTLTLAANSAITSGALEVWTDSRDVYTRVLSGNFHLTLAIFPAFLWALTGRPLGRPVQANAALNVALSVFMFTLGAEPVFDAAKPVRLVTLLPVAVGGLWAVGSSAWKGHREARLLLLTGLPLFVAAVRDRLVEFQGVIGQGWSSAAFAVFVVGMTLVMADRFGIAYTALARRERELVALNDAATRFVPYPFLRLLGKKDIREVALGEGIEREMTVLFSDIRGFTALSERMTPVENFAFINAYLGRMEPCVERAGGFIDKYIGDAVMALFPSQPGDAVQAALAMLAALEAWNGERVASGARPVEIGIGLNTGPCMLGTIGGPRRMDGTVIADAVNLAARVESATKRYGARLLVTGTTASGLGPGYRLREVDRVAVKGKEEPVSLFEVLDAEPKHLRRAKAASAPDFAEALRAFRARDWARARTGFERCAQQCPDDRASLLYLDRCDRFEARDPGPRWDGVTRLEEK